MKYISTRGNYEKVNSAKAITLGMVPNGGLFIPESIPKLNTEEMDKMINTSYQEITANIFNKFLTDFTNDEIEEVIKKAYNNVNFDDEDLTPIKKLNDNLYIMELWHGPTAAFKDMALQMLPHLLIKSKEKLNAKEETVILVATSGDTGKAALEGFKNIEGIKIIVFYPEEGVSEVQKLQMNTTNGNNTYVVALKGNFDDCQTGVKNIFSDNEFKAKLDAENIKLSSANSINWGRLLPQIVYYFKAYFDLVKKGEIKKGEKINFSVPTGNFGNILAGYYAKRMGLPVNKFICASNENKILTDFFETGIYDTKREFHKTMSPSMDILISSNLERFLFEMTDKNSEKLNGWYDKLQKTGKFQIDEESLKKMKEIIIAGFCDEKETLKTINETYNKYNYVLDTHTSVAVKVANDLKLGKIIVNSTASPYKFSTNVLKGLGEKMQDEMKAVERISEISKTEIHRAVEGIDKKEIIHKRKTTQNEMKKVVLEILGK